MRNAVIRKKRLQVERALEDFMRMPTHIMLPEIDITNMEPIDYDSFQARVRSTAIFAC